MISVDMTIREMVSLASNPSCTGDLYERIVKALETATCNAKMRVVANSVNYEGQYWKDKIAAIKSLRLATNWGLKESKEWIEDAQYSKTVYTCPIDAATANKLIIDLKACGCNCWIVPA